MPQALIREAKFLPGRLGDQYLRFVIHGYRSWKMFSALGIPLLLYERRVRRS